MYLDGLPDDRREPMRQLDRLIADVMQGHSRVLWQGVFWGGTEQSIIGYGDLTTGRPGGKTVEWFMVGLALQKQHLSIYVNAVEDGRYVAEAYRSELGKVKVGKASIAIKRVEDVDLDALRRVLVIARDQLDAPA